MADQPARSADLSDTIRLRFAHSCASGTSTAGTGALCSMSWPYATSSGASGSSTTDPKSDPHSESGLGLEALDSA